MDQLRIGVLGAARINRNGIVNPARAVPEVTVAAVAARDPGRAREFAAKHGVPVVHRDYEALLADPELDAVYIPLPNGLHEQWTLRALAAGKHVLCEKPLTSNAEQARRVQAAADGSGLVVMEAFHYRYHPLIRRVEQLLAEGAIGPVRHVRSAMCFPLPRFGDIRYNLALAGGATMDAGCYAIHVLRLLGGGEPQVVSAAAKLRSPGVDRAMTAQFRFEGGATGQMTASMWSSKLLDFAAFVEGERGSIRIPMYLMPSVWPRFTLVRDGRRTVEKVPGEATYTHQLRAFADAVLRGAPVLTPPADSVANMTVIDAVYRAAGLDLRP
ncbi:oxidoreductase [Catellatospora sp. TT07R-123]|uniref:Gfo/Idh/MocA family protein n=1 Tax=Catellatospora sp. TT07R-123 TaxID=2733863 RepID=UPI001B27B84E|nr:Gfo/Idh/MocA family oxidoreductase [Catellatospora sp. TT07R-123]GHJ43948.1 oxidoreductase [Catellatospora sp. TT07R-123]